MQTEKLYKVWDKFKLCWIDPLINSKKNIINDVAIGQGGEVYEIYKSEKGEGVNFYNPEDSRYEIFRNTWITDSENQPIFEGSVVTASVEGTQPEGFYVVKIGNGEVSLENIDTKKSIALSLFHKQVKVVNHIVSAGYE